MLAGVLALALAVAPVPQPASAQQVQGGPSVPQNVRLIPSEKNLPDFRRPDLIHGNGMLTLVWDPPETWGEWEPWGYQIQWKSDDYSHSTSWADVHELYDAQPHLASPQYRTRVARIDDPSATSFRFVGTQVSALPFNRQINVTNGVTYQLRISASAQREGTDGTMASHYRSSGWVEVAGAPPGLASLPDDLRDVPLVRSTADDDNQFTETAKLRPYFRVGNNVHKAQVACSATHVVLNLDGQQSPILELTGPVTIFGADGGVSNAATNWSAHERRIVVHRPTCPGWPSTDGDGRVDSAPAVIPSSGVPNATPRNSDLVPPGDEHSRPRDCPVVTHSHDGGASHMHQASVLNNECVYNIFGILDQHVASHRH